MSVEDVLARHRVGAFSGSDTACTCDRTWRTNMAHQAHLVDAFRALVAEERAAALREAADEIDRGPTFPLPPSVISALIREHADRETP